MKIEIVNNVKGMAIGGMFMAFFGGVWFFFALEERGILTVANLTGVAAGEFLLFAPAIYLVRAARKWPQAVEAPASRRAFLRANAAQWAGGFALFFILRWLHLSDYFMSGLTAIVGLHFFPLARIYRKPANHAPGSLLIAWSATSIVYVPLEHLPSITGFGTGLIIWQSSATVLSVAVGAVRESLQPQLAA